MLLNVLTDNLNGWTPLHPFFEIFMALWIHSNHIEEVSKSARIVFVQCIAIADKTLVLGSKEADKELGRSKPSLVECGYNDIKVLEHGPARGILPL